MAIPALLSLLGGFLGGGGGSLAGTLLRGLVGSGGGAAAGAAGGGGAAGTIINIGGKGGKFGAGALNDMIGGAGGGGFDKFKKSDGGGANVVIQTGGGGGGGSGGASGGSGGGRGLDSLLKMAGPVAATGAALTALTVVFGGVSKMAKNLAGIMSFLPNQISETAGALISVKDSFVGAFKSLTDVLALPLDAINDLAGAVGRFVKLSNPALVNRFTIIMEDGLASIGRSMEPLLADLANLARKVGNEFARLEPALKPTFTALGQVIVAFSESLLPLFKEMAPILMLGAAQFRILAKSIQLVGAPLVRFIQAMEKVGILAKLGIGGKRPGYDPERDSTGAAARQFTVQSSADDFQRDLAVKALSSGGPATPEEQVPPLLEKILRLMDTIATTLSIAKLAELLKMGVSELVVALKGVVGGSNFGTVQKFGAGVADGLSDLLRQAMLR